ncbi:VOC family protein [Nocardioides dilutus]
MTVRFQLAIDCADTQTMADFWAAALHYQVAPPPGGFQTWDDWYRSVGVPEEELGLGDDRIVDPHGEGPAIWFQVVPEAKSVKNRLHIDVDAGGGRGTPLDVRRERVEAEAERLVSLGATRLRIVSEEGTDHYAVAMLDPEGNEFDVF